MIFTDEQLIQTHGALTRASLLRTDRSREKVKTNIALASRANQVEFARQRKVGTYQPCSRTMDTNFCAINSGFVSKFGGTIRKYNRQQTIYLQGDPADDLFYVISGKVFVTIGAPDGKEALIAVLSAEDFFGEDCVDSEKKIRSSTVVAATDCVVAAFRTGDVFETFRDDPDFTRRFAAFLMKRNKQLKASLVDQMLLSSEKRLARLLLKFVPSGEETEPDLVDIPVNQDVLARMVGTTRPRVSEFMSKFRSLGHIEYSNGRLKVRHSLSSILSDGDA